MEWIWMSFCRVSIRNFLWFPMTWPRFIKTKIQHLYGSSSFPHIYYLFTPKMVKRLRKAPRPRCLVIFFSNYPNYHRDLQVLLETAWTAAFLDFSILIIESNGDSYCFLWNFTIRREIQQNYAAYYGIGHLRSLDVSRKVLIETSRCWRGTQIRGYRCNSTSTVV